MVRKFYANYIFTVKNMQKMCPLNFNKYDDSIFFKYLSILSLKYFFYMDTGHRHFYICMYLVEKMHLEQAVKF